MAEYREYLAILDSDPGNDQALAALEKLAVSLATSEAASALDATRESLRERGQLEVVERLFDVELRASQDTSRIAELLRKKAQLYADDLLNEESAAECFRRVLELRPDDADAQEALAHLDLLRENWRKVVQKYLDEAKASTDRQLTTTLYLSAAETTARYQPEAGDVEEYLRRALEVDAGNRRAATRLERLLRAAGKWSDLASLLRERIDSASTTEERVDALVALAELARRQLDDKALAVECMKKVVTLDPSHPRALSMLSDEYQKDENWSALVMLYTNALKARRRGAGAEVEVGTLLQIAMLHWKRLGNPDAAEEYFRRLRKVDPAHPAALDFYREYLRERGDAAQLVQIFRQALKAVPESDPARRRQLAIAVAEISEFDLANPEKAIEAWKGLLRAEPDAPEPREALRRLYARAEKWNALLDLIKDEIERRPPDDIAGRIEGLLQVVAIYRDHIKVAGDVMAINTYNAILALDPHHREAIDALAERYRHSGRWNDLISVLARKAELPGLPAAERIEILRQMADLWIERFGNYAQAVGPLEQLLAAAPGDRAAIARLKDIYTRRRQWRALIALHGMEAAGRPVAERRAQLVEMAHLATDRLGDSRLAIDIWNRVLELSGAPGPEGAAEGAGDEAGEESGQTAAETAEALAALATLYEKDKRYPALADVLRRQHELARTPAEGLAVLERLGGLFADKLKAPGPAADIYHQILAADPGHARAARTLREIYSQAGDYAALERVYAQLGQWDELTDALHAIADRVDDRATRLDLLERAARVATEHAGSQERIARAWERILSLDPQHLGAARALVPIYARTGKSARLLAAYEILLGHAEDDDRRLQLLGEIRALCEDRLGSKALAFQWAARAFELRPSDPRLLADLERLGAEADAWDEVAAILDRRVADADVGDAERVELLRELGKISGLRLHQPDRSQTYWERVLAERPDDPEAMAALEEIATHQADWPDLLKIFRRRVELESDRDRRLDLLFRIAFIEEERLADVDAAVATYRKVIELDPSSRRALKALAKLCEARGDWAGLADTLERELELTAEADGIVALLLRLGGLYENSLSAPDRALACYRRALSLQPSAQIHRLLERYLGEDHPAEVRVEVAALLLPAYEQADDAERIARAVEILRTGAPPEAQVDHDRRLVHLYGGRLGRPDLAYQAGLRVLEREPGRAEMREELTRLAEATGVLADYADHLELVLAELEEGEEAEATGVMRRDLAADLAELCLDRLVDLDRAERAWRVVLGIDPGDGAALAGLERIYRSSGRWSDLRDLCEEQLEHTLDNARRVELLFSIADLSESTLGDAEGAIAALARALEVDPSLVRAYKGLERLLDGTSRWRDLEELLAREAEVTPDAEAQVALLVRRARLRAEQLEDRRGAVDLLEEVITRHRGNAEARELLEHLLDDADERLRVARVLEPLYQEDGLWRDLCLVLRVQRELAGSREEAADLLARVAATEEEKLAHERGAFDSWREVLSLLPADERARAQLLRLGGQLGAWPEVAEALEGALAALDRHDVAARTAILGDLAHVAEEELRDPDRAQEVYRRLLDADPGNPEVARGAAQALDRLYLAAGRMPELIDIVRRQAEWADPGAERIGLLARLATLEEEAGDGGAAITAWREVLIEDPEDRSALDALERLYQQRGATAELADILRRRVELAGTADEKKQELVRLARLYERELDSEHDAVVAWLEILDSMPEDVESLDELARLYRAAGRHGDLLEILERRLLVAADARERHALLFEIGELLHLHLSRDAEALEQYASVLGHEPDHAGALVRIEAMLDDADLRLRAADVLLPLYEASGEWAKLAGLLLRVAEAVGDPRSRLRHLRRVAEIREGYLQDRAGALSAYRDAVAAAVAEPELRELLRELERVAAEEGRLGDLIDVYQRIAPDVFDGELQRRLYLDIADLARGVRRDDELARRYYQMVLDAQPDDARALAALEGLYRDGGDHEALYEVLLRKAERAGDDLEERAAALSQAAALCQRELGRPVDAMVVWEQVIELLPDSRAAAEALEELYEQAERWHDLTDLVERRLGFAFTVEEAVRLRFRLGQLCEAQLSDPDRAVENYSAALGGDPGHEGATAALERFLDDPGTRGEAAEVLEPIYVAHQAWPKLVRIYEIKLESASDPDERLQLSRYIARLHEDQLEDLEGAFRWYGRVFKENPGEPGLRSQLVRLAGVLEGWGALANIYQEYLDDTPGDSPEIQEVALALAELCDRRLGEVERAHAAYRRVLQANPDDHETFARLEAMLARAGRWFALADVYQEAIGSTLDDARRLDLYGRMAQVNEERLGDLARAIECHRAALEIDPDAPGPQAELDRLFQGQKQWFELSELLVARIERATDDEEQAALRVRLAEVLESRMNDPEAAIDQHEQVLLHAHGPGRVEVGPQAAALAALERLVVVERHRQRIAGILEPIYRANDWWRKLVVILGAQLDYVDDPSQKVAVLREIADIHETRGGDLGLALKALSRAWLEDTREEEVYQRLVALSARLSAWDALVATLEKALADELDLDQQVTILHRLADTHERSRQDGPAAIAALRRVLEIQPDDVGALASLDRLLAADARHDELLEVLARRAELADHDDERRALLERSAILAEQALGRPREAIASWRAVLAIDDADPRALDALERLYRTGGEPRELLGVLSRKIELADGPAAARLLRFAAAQVAEQDLREEFEAIAHLRAVLDADPDDREALAGLDRLYTGEESWPDLLEVLDRRIETEPDAAARADLRHRAALVVHERLLEPEAAIERLRALLAETPGHAAARATLDALTREEDSLLAAADVLEQVYRAEAAHERVAELIERRLAAPVLDRDERAAQMAELARLHEDARGDAAAAFAVWARALREAPEDEAIQGELERLAGLRGTWQELVELYEAMLADALSPEQEFVYASKLARLQEEALGDLDRAAEQYRRALDAASDERDTLDALARIYERAGRHEELAEILARQADAWLDEARQAEILFRLGDVREERLQDLPGAVAAYRDVLDREPGHGAARAALERLVLDERVRAEVIGTLEPLYEGERDFRRLADLLVTKLSVTPEAGERAAIYARVAELAEEQLDDPVGALDAVGGWLAEDPLSEEALAELDRLAEATGRWSEVVARLRGIAASSDSDAVRLPLLGKLGAVQLDRERDLAGAEQTFRLVLELEPESAAALTSLERIYRDRGDRELLAEVLWRRGEIGFDAVEKRACLAEVAELREQLGDAAGAIEAWGAVLELDEGDREALARAAAIYERHQQWPQLIEALEAAARFAPDAGEERELRVRIARLWDAQVGDLDRAAAIWQTVLDIEPGDRGALDAIEDVHRRRGDWQAVQDALTRRLDFADSDADRVAIYLRMAQVAEVERGLTDNAISYLQQVLDLDAGNAQASRELERLLRAAERWHELVELYERRAEIEAGRGDTEAETRALAQAADVWEGPLEDADAAGEILEKILERRPEFVPALTRLARIYHAAEDWDRSQEVLERALALGPTGADAAELHVRLGEAARRQAEVDGAGDEGRALEHFLEALRHDPDNLEAIAAAEGVARRREDWNMVADLMNRRWTATTAPDDRLALALELAELWGDRLGQPARAVPLLEEAVQLRPDDPRALAPLADLYLAAGRHADAAPLYGRLADEARKRRQMKDVARYRQRLGQLHRAAGAADEALAAYEEAFRIDPTAVPTMVGLGELYVERQDWDKARRVYRSLVLQNIDDSLGITKGEVYYRLGRIHVELGEKDKAKGMFQRATEMEPGNQAYKQALAEL